MLDKASKCLLDFLNKQPFKRYMYFDEVEYPDKIGSEDNFFATVDYLEEKGLVKIVKNRDGYHLGVQLSHPGRHRTEFSWLSFIEYLKDQWIAILALVISIIALLMP